MKTHRFTSWLLWRSNVLTFFPGWFSGPILLIAWFGFGQPTFSQIPEIPRPFMRGYAQATTRNGRPVIYYNPRSMRRLGPQVHEFIRSHEYAHHQLNHLNRSISVQQAEAEADIYAARTASPAAVRAAQAWFQAGNGGSRQHGSGWERARRLDSGTYAMSSQRLDNPVPARLSAGSRMSGQRGMNTVRRVVRTSGCSPYRVDRVSR